MLSFRVDDGQAREIQAWADALGLERSELLREAVRRQLVRLAAERDSLAWETTPLTPEESSLSSSAAWGPAEDWSDWAASGPDEDAHAAG